MDNNEVREEITENTSNDVKNEKASYGEVIQNYKVLKDYISQMNDEIKVFDNILKSDCEEAGVKYESLIQDMITFLSNESFDITKFTLDSVSEEMLQEIRENLLEDGTNVSNEEIFALYERAYDLIDMRKQSAKMTKEADKLITEYSNYLSSPDYEAAKKERLEKLEEALVNEPDGPKKREIQKMVDVMKSTMNLSFIFTRIDKVGDKDIDNIVTTFFDSKKSAYIIDKYRAKASKLGYNPDIYKYFFNIEEKYLEEKYHVFNNLFLFFVMRYVGYSTTDISSEKMYCQTLISNLGNLIYYKFPTEDDRELFLSCIRKVLDRFESYRDKFDKDNFLHPNHPYRKEKDAEHDKELRDMIFTNLKNNNVAVTDEMKDMSTEDLKKRYKEILDNLEEEHKKSKAGTYARKIAEMYGQEPEIEVSNEDIEEDGSEDIQVESES